MSDDRSVPRSPRTNVRDAIEGRLEAWGHLVHRHAWLTIGLVLAIVIGLASQLPQLEIDTSTEGLLEEGDPVRVAYDAFREQFGRDEIIVLAIHTRDIFSPDSLARLRALHEDIEDQVPKLEDVTSLINVRETRGEGDELIVGDFVEDWPTTPAEFEALRARALANPLYRNQILSEDGRFTAVVIQTDAYSSIAYDEGDLLAGFESDEGAHAEERPFLTGAENTEIVLAIQALVERHQAPDFEVFAGGNPIMIDEIMNGMLRDMGIFAALALAVVSVLLGLLFRSALAVLLSLVVSVLAVISSLAVMAMIGMPLMAPTQIMPSFLLAVGVGNSVHLIVIYLQASGRGDGPEDALAYALGHSGLAIAMTALTTAGGLVSFTTAEIAPVGDVGIICPIGALIALAFTLVLLPALIAVTKLGSGARQNRAWQSGSGLRQVSIRCGALGTRRPGAVLTVWGIVLALGTAGALRTTFSHEPLAWFAEDHPLRVATERINDELKGVITLEVLVDSGRENGLHDPDLLRRMAALQAFSEGVTVGPLYIGKTVSLADVSREIHQALNENEPEFYVIPDDRQLLSQELLLFENSGSDDLEDVVDSQFRVGRVTLKLPMADAIGFEDLFDALEPGFDAIIGDAATYTITGSWSIMGRTIVALTHSLARTYVVAFATIAPLMMLLLGSVRLGLLSMIPNVAAIVVTVGIMGWFGWPFDTFTLMVGSIALGLAVDDTIHFMHNFRRAYARLGEVQEAVRVTLESTGQALFFTSVVLASGFFIYMFATMKNLYYFGLLTGVAIALAYLANVTLAPALVTVVARTRFGGMLRRRADKPPVDASSNRASDGSTAGT